MAWVHFKTNEILHEITEDFKQEDFYHVDDLLAIPVVELNKKGYITTSSCAGHPFPVATVVDTFVELEKAVTFDDLAESIVNGEPKGDLVPFVHRTYLRRMTYIQFRDPLPESVGAPQGWNYDEEENLLYTRYKKKGDAYSFTNEQLKKIDELLIWIEESPNAIDANFG